MQILKGIIKKKQSGTMTSKLPRITYLHILNKNNSILTIQSRSS